MTENGVEASRALYHGSYSELVPAAKGNRLYYADYISEVLNIINQMRAEKGVRPLVLSEKLTEQANVRAEEIAWSGSWPANLAYRIASKHTRPNGTLYTSLFKENGYGGYAGENLAKGQTSPSEVCTDWKNSSGHYNNIVNSNFTEVGIGISEDPVPVENGGLGMIWVLHFHGDKS